MDAVVQFRAYTYAYPGADHYVLKNINLKIEAGQCHCLTGRTGSGKSTLALAVKGLLPPGKEKGDIIPAFSPHRGGTNAGIVLQNPETQVLTSTLGAEVAFGLENLCVDPALMPEKVEEALSVLGLDKPLDFETDKLSMGEKYRLIVASHLVMAANLLVLDEPAGQLDPDGLERLLKVIHDLKGSGIAFLLCENRPEPLCEAIDFYWHLTEDGTIRPGRHPQLVPASGPEISRRTERRRSFAGEEEVIGVSGLAVKGREGIPLWSDVSFSIPRGRRVAVYGANGAGKTTLLRCLTGFVQPCSGEVTILSEKPAPGKLRGRVGFLFQNPQRQLFEASVFEEIAFSLKRLRTGGKELASKVLEVLALCGIEDLADFSPHKLSYGQKHLAALASALASQPEILILDDPFAGLDGVWRQTISDLLFFLSEKGGATIIQASHDPEALKDWADLILYIEGGKIVAR